MSASRAARWCSPYSVNAPSAATATSSQPAYQAPRRNVSEARPRRRGGEATCEGVSLAPADITAAPQSLDQFGGEAAIDLVSQTADQDVDDVGLRVERVVPQMLHEHGLAQHAFGVA